MSTNLIDSEVFRVAQSSKDLSLPTRYTPIVLNSTKMSGNDTREMIAISSNALPEPQIVTIDSDSNEPTMPFGLGRQLPSNPPSLNDLNLSPNPIKILAAMALVSPREGTHDENYSPPSPEPSDPSPIPTPPMNVSTIDGRETPHTTTDDNTFYSKDEPRRVHWTSLLDETFFSEGEPKRICLLPSPSPLSPPRKMRRKLETGMSFRKRRGVSLHVCEACGEVIPTAKIISEPSTKN